MSFLFARSKKKPIPEFTGLQVQTSVNVLPIPIVYGSPRVPINIIYANGFSAHSVESSGGKGLLTGGKGGQTSGYTYTATLIGALCEGPIGPVRAVFDNQAVYNFLSQPLGRPLVLFTGAPGQIAWPYITATYPSDAFAYKDTALLGLGPNYQLDSSATVPQLSFVFDGPYAGSTPLNLYVAPDLTSLYMDADPGLCLFDLLINTRYGMEFPGALLDATTLLTTADGFVVGVGDAAVSTYAQAAAGIGWSVVFNNTEPGLSILDRLCTNLGVAIVWTGTILKFIPYWDTYSAENPGYDAGAGLPLKYYNPQSITAPIFSLSDSDYIQTEGEDDPVSVTRTDVSELKNVFRLDFMDRYNLFNATPVEAKDEVSVDLYGSRSSQMATASEFTHVNYASMSAQLQMQRSVAIRNTYEFKLPWIYCVLEPMDVVLISDSVLGLDEVPVRIRSITEDEKGNLTIIAEEFPTGAASSVLYPKQDNTPSDSFLTNQTVGDVNAPAIFEPTAQMIASRGETGASVQVGLSGCEGTYDPAWGGAVINISNDNVTYAEIGTFRSISTMGVLVDPLPAYSGANPDTGNTLTIDLSESNGSLPNFTAAQASLGLGACVIIGADRDVEIIGYETATLIAPNTYELTNLWRGLFGTNSNCSHQTNDQFLRADANVFSTLVSPEFLASTVYFKFQSFNIFGQALQELADCTAYTYIPTGQGMSNANNPIVLALSAGIPVDLNSGSATWNLNIGGSGPCAPIGVVIDLN